MITWMQRHKKYLIITIWISTIAFIGAGFVGWGQYSYGDKAGAIAKVGKIEITQGEFQKAYSNLYSQYSQMFQGDFDKERAKQFGLEKQAFTKLKQQALVLNLAASYGLTVTTEEIIASLVKQEEFYKNGVFDKETYKEVLKMSRLSTQEYEDEIKNMLLVQKTLSLLPGEAYQSEIDIFNTIMNIADKINYKILDKKDIKININDASLKAYWETQKHKFMTDVNYDLAYLTQSKVIKNYSDAKVSDYYTQNKTHFKDTEGKITPLENVKEKVIDELNINATKKEALRTYIAYKKGKLNKDTQIATQNISSTNNPFNEEILNKISKLSVITPYLKPVLVNGEYITVKLLKTNESKIKSFENAKKELLPLFVKQEQEKQLTEIAQKSVSTFSGTTTDFFTVSDMTKLGDLSEEETKNFIEKLFLSQKKNAYITLTSGKVILYNILEQKMLTKTNEDQRDTVLNLKNSIFNTGLIAELQKKYQTEIFVKGLQVE